MVSLSDNHYSPLKHCPQAKKIFPPSFVRLGKRVMEKLPFILFLKVKQRHSWEAYPIWLRLPFLRWPAYFGNVLNLILRDSLKKAQLGGFMNPFVHQLRSSGSRRSAGGVLSTALCWGLGCGGVWGWHTPWWRVSRNVASPWRSVQALLLPARDTDRLDMAVETRMTISI